MLTVDLFSIYLLSRVDIVIRYIEVDFTFGLPDYIHYIEEFAILRFYSVHFTITLAWTWISLVISRTSLNRGSLNQGSTVLGPTLFCIHITSVVSTTPESSVFLYAHDTEIHHLSPNLETAVLKINSNLQNISTWLRNDNLILNTKKEEAMIVAKKAPMSSADILLNNNELSVVETFKYLVVTVDSHLNWEPHISQLIERVSPKIAFLNRLAGFLDTNISNSCHTAWNV